MIDGHGPQGLRGVDDGRPTRFASVTADVRDVGSALRALELEVPDDGTPVSRATVCYLWLEEVAARRSHLWCVVPELSRLRRLVAATVDSVAAGTFTAGATELVVFDPGRDLLPAPYQRLKDAPYRTLALQVRELAPFLEAFDRAVARAVSIPILPGEAR